MTAAADLSRAALYRVRAALEQRDCRPRERGDHLDARCPAHDDRRPSLSVDWRSTPDRGGFVVLRCHTGCEAADVVAALGLQLHELFDGPSASQGITPARQGRKSANAEIRPARAAAPAGRPVRSWPRALGAPDAVYAYTDAAGELAGEVGRFTTPEGKTFRWRRPALDRPGCWYLSKPVDPPLYRLPEVVAAVAAGRTVYLVEGEKDADAIAAAGEVATTKPNGAVKHPDEWAQQWREPLRGARVVIVADRDDAGYRHAACVRAALADVAADVAIVRTPLEQAKADAADHLAAGLALPALEPVPAELLPDVAGDDDQGAAGTVLPFPRRGGGGPGDGGAGEPAATRPRWPIPMSQGSWRYSTGHDGDGIARGVYQWAGTRDDGEWTLAGPLPYALERIHVRDGEGRRRGVNLRLSMTRDGAEAAVCDREEIQKGEWADRLAVPLSADDKVVKAVATAIRMVADRYAVEREATPRWHAGALELPPVDVGPAGYGEVSADERAARQAFAEVAEIATANPKLALVAGTAFGGLFLEPLQRQAFVCLLGGQSSLGKTTALKVCAALVGNPADVVASMNTTAMGLPAYLGELRCLPAYVDELELSKLTASDLGALVLQIAEGARRRRANRRGPGSTTTPGWRSVATLSGNVTIVSRAPQEGVLARVVELATPIVATAGESKRLKDLVSQHYGWPLRWLLAAGLDVEAFRAELERAETDLGVTGDGVAGRLGEHFALCVAGAALFGRVMGAPGVRAAALSAARTSLAELVEEIRERGMTPQQRLLRGIVAAAAARPAAFPTLSAWRSFAAGATDPRVREIEGYADTLAAGREIGLLPASLDAIAKASGVEDPRPALRELRTVGVLVTTAGRGFYKRTRIADLVDLHVFRLTDDDDARPDATAGDVPPEGNRSTSENASSTSENAPEFTEGTPEFTDGKSGFTGEKPMTGHLTERRLSTPEPCTGCGLDATWSYDGKPWHPPCKERADDAAALDAVASAPATPELEYAAPAAPPAAASSAAERQTDDVTNVNPAPVDVTAPATPAPAASSPAPATARATTTPARPRTSAARGTVAAVVTADTAYLALLGEPVRAVELPADVTTLAGLFAWADSIGLGVRYGGLWRHDDDGQLWLMPDVAERLGLPATRPADKGAATRLRTRVATELGAAGWQIGKSAFWSESIRSASWWVHAWREGHQLGLRLVVPQWAGAGDCPLLAGEPAPDRLAARLARYAAEVGRSWRVSGASTGVDLTQGLRARARTSVIEAADPPPPAKGGRGLREMPLEWQRPASLDELTARWVHAYDKNGAYLSAMSSVWLGLGAAVHRDAPAFDAKLPGYWRVEPANWDFSRLPDPYDPMTRGDRGPVWFTTPSLQFLLERGWWDGRVIEAYVYPETDGGKRPGVRYLEQTYKVLRDARERLYVAEGDDAAAVLKAVKGTYTGLGGKFNALRSGPYYRPEWWHNIIGTGRSALLRKLADIGENTGRYPLAIATDCVLYASDDPDPYATGVALGLPLDPPTPGARPTGALGKFKLAGTRPMGDVAPLLAASKRLHPDLMDLFREEGSDDE